MTETLFQDDGGVEFRSLVNVLKRVFEESQSFLEIKYCGLTIHLFPTRALPGPKVTVSDRMRHFANFVLELAKEVKIPPVVLAFEWRQGAFAVGVTNAEGLHLWMPGRVVAFERTNTDEPLTLSFPFLDDVGQVEVLRRIRL